MRLAAAQELLGTASPAVADLLREALSGERDDEVRAAMEIGLASIEVNSDDPAKRLQAIEALDGSLHQEVRALLDRGGREHGRRRGRGSG